MAQADRGHQSGLRTVLIVLVGQVGCVTLVVILLSVWLGLWLDSMFHTKPLITLALLAAGIPLSVFGMLQVARRTVAKIVDQQQTRGGESP
jgi:F0F1-type ATP synthase assembly protein I